MTCCVIMAGGKGERFWPKSRAVRPKQFTDIFGAGNMLQLTYQRVAKLVEPDRIFVVTGSEYKDITMKSVPGLAEENIILEPAGRNTAPCIGLAAVTLRNRFPEDTMVILPADHTIKEDDRLVAAITAAVNLAQTTSGLVTIGIRPTRPETGYGYLKTGMQISPENTGHAYRVERFVEKPGPEKAREYLEDGGYLWNAGIFVWRIPVIIKAFQAHLPEMYEGLCKIESSMNTDEYNGVLNQIYPHFQKISIDYGIMEKVSEVYTVPGEFYWDDVGTWQSLERILGTDPAGNVLRGNTIVLDTKNSIVDAGDRLVAVIGADNLIVVETEDITFICDKNRTDSVRELLEQLRSQKLEKYL